MLIGRGQIQLLTSSLCAQQPGIYRFLISTRSLTEYEVGGPNLIYCTAEIFTWAKDASGSFHSQILKLGDELDILLLWRNDAYNYWVTELLAKTPIANYSSLSKSTVIVKGPYLIRTAILGGGLLRLTGDINGMTAIELTDEPNGKLKEFRSMIKALCTIHNGAGNLATFDF